MKALVSTLAFSLSVMLLTAMGSFAVAGKSGEALFKEHCAACHPDGGNIVNPKKTLKKKDLTANNISSEEAIVKIMRNPGPGMLTFDPKTISDDDARAVAKYVLSTFGK